MSLQRLVTVDDILKIVEYLKAFATGVEIETAKKTVDPRLLDRRRLKAYREWGFVQSRGTVVTITELGRKYVRAADVERKQLIENVIRDNEIYRTTLGYIHHNSDGNITVVEVGHYWRSNFSTEASSAEGTLKEQVICFAKLVDSAKLGTYKVGRKGGESRIEFDTSELSRFVVGEDKTPSDESNVTSEPADLVDNESDIPTASGLVSRVQSKPTFSPTIHIDVQVHISPDAEATQIDEIFASMAKHLFQPIVASN